MSINVQKGLTALAHAAHKGHTEVVRVLLSCADTDVNVTNKVDINLVIFGCRRIMPNFYFSLRLHRLDTQR